MFGFVVYTLLIGAFFYGVIDRAKPLLALGLFFSSPSAFPCLFRVSLCPVLAITSTFGVCTIAGHRTNSVMLIMPFLYQLCFALLFPSIFRLLPSFQHLRHRRQ